MATSIAITSGKGGTGKSALAVNLALRLNAKFGRALYFDADFAMANGHVLLNMRPALDIVDVITHRRPLQDVVQMTDSGLSIVPGRTGAHELLDMTKEQADQLISAFNGLIPSCDFLVIDTAAGSEHSTLACAAGADHVVVVLLGEATSFVDAYAFIKNSFLEHGVRSFSVVVNMARSATEGRAVFEAFRRSTVQFLDVTLDYCGHIPFSQAFRTAAVDCRPVVLNPGNKIERAAFDAVAEQVLASRQNTIASQGFFRRGRQGTPVHP